MPEIIEKLSDFPGFAVKYDPLKNPFFRPIMVENLRRLKSVDIGKKLLDDIAGGKPQVTGDASNGHRQGVNVLCVPTKIHMVQSGYRLNKHYGSEGSMSVTGMRKSDHAAHAPQGCPFHIDGGSCNQALKPSAAANGQGSVCFMRFTNVQIMTRKGEKADPYIVLAHELIHSYHALYGITKDGKDEELWTTGIGTFVNEPMSENKFRDAFKLPLRNQYF